jgi:hypothetical protein
MLHGQHQYQVALATKPLGWRDFEHYFTHPHDIARAMVADLAAGGDNAYLSQNGFKGRRSAFNAHALTSLYVDLDTYKVPELATVSPEATLLESVLAAHPWLHPPTLLAFSGRGMYLVWVLDKPLPHAKLPDWQAAENDLVELLTPFGADPAAKDAARILRVCDSVNTKSGERVWYQQIHDPVRFTELASALRQHTPKKPRLAPVGKTPPYESAPALQEPVTERRPKGVARFYNGYTLAYARMQDLDTLASMRGPLDDYRHRILYVYSVAAAWYCPTPDSLVNELDAFAEHHFVDAHRYQGRARCKAVLDRMVDAKQGHKAVWRGEEVDPRYRMQNRTIIRLLDITDTEQLALKAIISTAEKGRRKRERDAKRYRRRRDEYLAEQARQTECQRQQLLELLKQPGVSKAQAAQELGLSRTHIYRLLAKV